MKTLTCATRTTNPKKDPILGASLTIHKADELSPQQVDDLCKWLEHVGRTVRSMRHDNTISKRYRARIWW